MGHGVHTLERTRGESVGLGSYRISAAALPEAGWDLICLVPITTYIGGYTDGGLALDHLDMLRSIEETTEFSDAVDLILKGLDEKKRGPIIKKILDVYMQRVDNQADYRRLIHQPLEWYMEEIL